MSALVQFLFDAFRPPPLAEPPQVCPPGVRCVLSGTPIGVGYPVGAIASNATADAADTFRVPGAWMGEPAARLFRDHRGLASNLLALPGHGLKPMVARATATEARPCWRDLVMALGPGTPTVAVVTSDAKRRLWPQARLSTVGARWQPYLHDGPISRSLAVDVWRLRDCLALVEAVYSHGFSKRAIAGGLLDISAAKAAQAIGLAETARLEHELACWRDTDEFLLSVFVAQKSDQPPQEEPPCQTFSTPSPGQLSLW